jgi:putative endonuclease
MPKLYYVYILSSQRRVLYIGLTSNIEQRVFQHKTHVFGGFTAKYNVTNLVYFERHGAVMTAIRREKELKAWRRGKDQADRIHQSQVARPKLRMVSTPPISTRPKRGMNSPHRPQFRNQIVILRRAQALRRTVRGLAARTVAGGNASTISTRGSPVHCIKAFGLRKVPRAGGNAAFQDDEAQVTASPESRKDWLPLRNRKRRVLHSAHSRQQGIVAEECDLLIFSICGGWRLGLGGAGNR